MPSKDESDAATKDKTAAAKSGEPTTQSAMGVTVTVTKGPTPPLMGVTVTRSPAKGGTQTPASPGQAEVVPSSKPAPSAGAIPEGEEEEVEEIPTITPREPTDSAPRSPIKAWGEEAKAAPADKGACSLGVLGVTCSCMGSAQTFLILGRQPEVTILQWYIVSRNSTNGKQPPLTSVTSCQTRRLMRIDCKAEIVTSTWRPWIKNVCS